MPYTATSTRNKAVRTQTPVVRLPRATTDEGQRIHDTLKRDVGPGIGKAILSHVEIKAALMGPLPPSTAAVQTTITHGLGFVPTHFLPCVWDAAPWFWPVSADEQTMTFASLVACNVIFLVY